MSTKHARIIGFLSLGILPLGAGCDVPPGDEMNETRAGESEAVESSQQNLIVPGTRIGSGEPGGAIFNDVKYLTYTDSNGRINVMRESGSWVRQLLTEKASAGSSLYVWRGFMYLSWVGSDGLINTMRTSDGVNWGDKRVFSWGVSGLPAITDFEGTLQLVVRYGKIPEFWNSPDGVNWNYGGELSDVRSNTSFALTYFESNLVVAWRDESSRKVAVRSYSSSRGWSPTTITNVFGNPSLDTVDMIAPRNGTVRPAQLALAVRGDGFGGASAPVGIWRSRDMVNFTKEQHIGGGSTERKPVIARSYYNSLATTTATDVMTNDVVWIDTDGRVRWDRF